MQQLLDYLHAGSNSWVIQIFLVVLATVLLHFALRLLLLRLVRYFLRTPSHWDDSLIGAATTPLLLAIWIMGISVAAAIINLELAPSPLFAYAGLVRRIAIILLLMLFLTRFIRNVEQGYLDRKKPDLHSVDETTIKVMARLLRLTVLITGALILLQTAGISISGVVAFGGIGGIAVGFAAKDLLANFFGGLMIYLDRPFSVGDWVRSPDREIEGTVEEIGWRLTRIVTLDRRPLYIPNGVFATIAVENPSRMSHRRIREVFGLRYSDAGKIRKIVADVKTLLQQHPQIDKDCPLVVNFNTLSASSLDFFIYAFTRTVGQEQFHEVKQELLLEIIDIIHQEGADLAFPTCTVDGLGPNLVQFHVDKG